MTTYTLNLNFKSSADVAAVLAAGEMITLLKASSMVVGSGIAAAAVASCSQAAPLQVAWLAFPPIQSNIVSWSDSNVIFAAQSLTPGAVIIVQANSAIQVTQQRPYTSQGTFGAVDTSAPLPVPYFGCANQYTNSLGYMGFGPAQAATVNGLNQSASPFAAAYVPQNQSAAIQAQDIVSVFLQTGTSNGMVLPLPISQACQCAFSASVTEISASYNSSLGQFQITSG